jgi:cell fate (sporulation/competence/biofilm development) regulator YmcA (YheA/YmcA/DUF963 family)
MKRSNKLILLQSKNATIEAINEHMKLKEVLDKHGISTQDVDKLLKNNCETLSKQVEECNKVLPLAQKIVAMNIGISELLAL